MFGKQKTVDGILSDFRRTVEALRDLAIDHGTHLIHKSSARQALVEEHKAQLAEIDAHIERVDLERNRAHVIANKLEALIGV